MDDDGPDWWKTTSMTDSEAVFACSLVVDLLDEDAGKPTSKDLVHRAYEFIENRRQLRKGDI